MKRVVGVIPSRWGSTRFPGKSLALIAGKPLIQWVIERARQATSISSLVVATDDARIVEAVRRMDVEVVMTRSDHPSGTDRVAEAIQKTDAEVVVNIQGDEPLVDPALIDQLGRTLAEDASWDMATASAPIVRAEDRNNPSVVKVVWGRDQQALYFSRSLIPHQRDVQPDLSPGPILYWRHIGLYAYQRSFLEKLVRTPPCLLEQVEKLEQLRALYLGCRMKVLTTEDIGMGVDHPEDVTKVEKMLKGIHENT